MSILQSLYLKRKSELPVKRFQYNVWLFGKCRSIINFEDYIETDFLNFGKTVTFFKSAKPPSLLEYSSAVK